MATKETKMPPVYIAAIAAEAEGGYSVSFPDLAGCFSQGETFADAVRYAGEAAAQWLEAKGGYPTPGDPSAVIKSIVKAGAIPAAIEAPALRAKVVPVTISLPAAVLRRIDMAAEMRGLSRSGYIGYATMRTADMPADLVPKGRPRRPRAKRSA